MSVGAKASEHENAPNGVCSHPDDKADPMGRAPPSHP
jgi:hypothetical protein